MKIKLIIVLMSLTIVGYSQNKTVESIEKQVEEFYVKFEKLDQSKQRIESNKLVNFLNTTDSKTRELWIAAMDKHEKALKEKSTSKSTELKINVTAFSEIPEELQGCSFVFSKSKEAYLNNKFLYFDDMGENAIISIDNKIQKLRKKSTFIEGEDENEITVYSNDLYSVYVGSKVYIGETEEEGQVYSALLVITDNKGNKVKVELYGEGGC